MAAKHAFVNVTRARVKIEKFMHDNETSQVERAAPSQRRKFIVHHQTTKTYSITFKVMFFFIAKIPTDPDRRVN